MRDEELPIAYFRNYSLKNAEVATANYQNEPVVGARSSLFNSFPLVLPLYFLKSKNFLPQSKREASPHSTSKFGKGFMIKDRTIFFPLLILPSVLFITYY